MATRVFGADRTLVLEPSRLTVCDSNVGPWLSIHFIPAAGPVAVLLANIGVHAMLLRQVQTQNKT